MAPDHLVAQIVEAAERDGGPVEDPARRARAQLAGQTVEAVANQDGPTTATHDDAKIIEFRPRRVGA
ncbi:hypothetical protein ACIQNI_09050 [Streptomyces sp. NPDC091266]|uniref:hypothetical protein n=1 Tax=Streptomyces sp. NPDC091266 TaxID=3365978 RepID=UPI0037F9D946